MDKLDLMGLTETDLNNMEDFISEYEYIEKALGELEDKIQGEELKKMVSDLKDFFWENEDLTYKKYKDTLEEYENFDYDNYDLGDTNAELNYDYEMEIRKGLR